MKKNKIIYFGSTAPKFFPSFLISDRDPYIQYATQNRESYILSTLKQYKNSNFKKVFVTTLYGKKKKYYKMR